MHLRDLGNLCPSTVYNQRQLIINFYTVSCGLNQRRLTIELIMQVHNWLPEKANENIANQRKHKLYRRWSHEIRHRGPSAKIAPGTPTLQSGSGFRTSRNAAVLSHLNFIPLFTRRELHTLLFFYKTKTGLTFPVLHSFLLLCRP